MTRQADESFVLAKHSILSSLAGVETQDDFNLVIIIVVQHLSHHDKEWVVQDDIHSSASLNNEVVDDDEDYDSYTDTTSPTDS